ncbi:MAG TPA: SprT family zinc-dependent metalloprotease [Saprospiraceae bacterium]|nr:SprT family zinc-dependent metalloprotease [Saprospiraceae bacterium]HMP25519.1 SprT family zinc-dependent metalloprotease [Saprospiraceae bacterium]
MSIERIQFGSREITFELIFQKRKTLGITVHPSREVTVKAPLDAPLEKIKTLVKKRAPWILKQQSYFLSFEPLSPPRRYVSGETHLYLGKQYRLKIYASDQESVKLKRGFLEVYATGDSDVKTLVQDWYRRHAMVKFAAYAEPWIERFRRYGVMPSEMIVKPMEKRWGSCTPKGRIILNTELIQAPRGCIEYVLVHELCHLVHHNHSRAFFDLQTREMPDWERWKDRLERFLA